jgi:hypothetical protein
MRPTVGKKATISLLSVGPSATSQFTGKVRDFL